MPFKSQAQRAACYAADDPNWDCKEWEVATPKGKKLPKRVSKGRGGKKAVANLWTKKIQVIRNRKKQAVRNVFCPTGSGGGIDPTCGSEGRSVRDKGDTVLAHPEVILGFDLPIDQNEFMDYLERHGQEYSGAKLPDTIRMGTPKECYKNSTLTMLEHRGLDYCEGVAYPASFTQEVPSGTKYSLGFMHAWLVTKDGEVVDPTWVDPEKCRYFGVKYDKKEYMKHITKTKMYGVFGGDDKTARKVLAKDGGKLVANYSPDQPRDERGRWAAVGSESLQTSPFASGTMGKYLHEDGTWDPSRKPIHDAVLASFTSKVTAPPDGQRVLYMTGGGFGSGKSTLLDKYPEHVGFPTKDKVPVADPDAAKQFIPEMAQRVKIGDKGAASYVHEESSLLAKQGVVDALKDNRSVIYDTSGDSDPDKLHGKVEGYRKLGATRVVGHYATPLSFDEAMRRVESRQSKSQGVRRELSRVQVEVNHREVSRCWQAAAKRGTFDELGLWSTAGKMGDPPKLIARAVGGHITVHEKDDYQKFLDMGK